MIFDNTPLTAEQFLAEYWQKKPLLVRQALPGFTPDLGPDDIAGLACDDLAESRLVTGSFPEQDWNVRYGPFSGKDFKNLPETDWTLLVQDVEKHYPPLRSLIREFSFLPRWRIDDLMVSVAGPGGSVGPHVDQYDVFLLQAQGRRRWQISGQFDDRFLDQCELKVLREFSPEQDWLLEPGDLLYLPPGIAHHGVAEGDCMTWSIGMRAPSQADLLLALGEWLAEREDEGGRYRDPPTRIPARAGEVDAHALARLQHALCSPPLADADFHSFLGSFLSRYRLAHDPAAPATAVGPADLTRELARGRKLRHNPWTRLLWIESGKGALLFAAGARFSCSVDLAGTICDPDLLASLCPDLAGEEMNLLCELVNRGHLYLEEL